MRIDTGSPEQVGLVRITKYVVFLDSSCLPRVINSCSTHRFVDMSESDSSNCQTPVVNSPSSEMPSNELRGQIYATCRDGDLLRLRAYVENRSKDKLGELVNSATNGATPLIMACRNGHITVVTFLVNRCGADIELSGSVTFDFKKINKNWS
jgi:ankyrin repeat protein